MSFFGAGTTDFDIEVRKGNVSGTTAASVIGHSDTVNTTLRTLYHEMATADLDTIALYDTPATIKVASTSASDDAGQPGALTVRVVGVNGAGALTFADFTLNGQTETAASSVIFKAIHSVIVLTAGAGGANVGVIWVGNGTFTAGVPVTKYGAIEIATNLSAIAQYLVPAGKTLYLKQLTLSLGDTTKVMNAQVQVYDGTLLKEVFDLHSDKANAVIPIISFPGLAPLTLFRVNVAVDQSTAKATVAVASYLVDD